MRLIFVLILGLLLGSCQPESPVGFAGDEFELDLPPGFGPPPVPADNGFTASRVELGRLLFYDPVLSRDSSISCGSCHRQELAFTDGKRISPGIDGRVGTRNTPTLVNMAYQPHFFAEGGSPTLELQAIGPIEEFHEMDQPIGEAARRARQNPRYQQLARQAYERDLDPYVITRALSAFQRTLISGRSSFDRYYREGDSSALSPQQKEGMTLFFSDRTQCSHCHGGLHLSDFDFYNIGLYSQDQADKGRFRITLDSADIGAFKTPSLRNVALTAPYMHDGSLPHLRAVIEHFDQGGQGHRLQAPQIRPLTLSESEKAALIAFLHSLTDDTFLTNPDFAAP
jgi:cytochrome c peroxidase